MDGNSKRKDICVFEGLPLEYNEFRGMENAEKTDQGRFLSICNTEQENQIFCGSLRKVLHEISCSLLPCDIFKRKKIQMTFYS